MHKALSMGATRIATGHYARIIQNKDKWQLLRGCDNSKDQSYALSMLGQSDLRRTLFPIGSYTKNKIRSLANDFDLPVAQRQDSRDLCFLADKDYRRFLQDYAPQSLNPGPIMNLSLIHI